MEKKKGRKAYEEVAKNPKLLKLLDEKGFGEYFQALRREWALKTDFYESL